MRLAMQSSVMRLGKHRAMQLVMRSETRSTERIQPQVNWLGKELEKEKVATASIRGSIDSPHCQNRAKR